MRPLTPADCNIREFPKMMIHVGRLKASTFNATADSEAWRAGVNLWMDSWHNVPAGSLVDGEGVLMKAADLGRDVKTWRRVKEEAMRGWVLCEDGRWYHPVVAETVLEVWINKLLRRLSSGHGNFTRYGTPFDRAGIVADICTAAEMLERLDPKADILKKDAVAKARAGLPVGDVSVPPGRQDVPPGARRDRKGREGNPTPKPPGGASVEIDWKGPGKVREIVEAAGFGGYLGYFTWRDVPEKASTLR